MSTLQTLDRGLRALDFVAHSPSGVTVSQIAEHLQVHRAIAYRVVATLEQHHLVARGSDSRVRLGAGVTELSRRFAPQLLDEARPVLHDLAESTGATAFLSVAERDECVVVAVEHQRRNRYGIQVSYREGTRHPLDRGAPGIAILATREPSHGDTDDIVDARRLGYSVTHGQLQPGAVGVSTGFRCPPSLREVASEASVGVVALGDLEVESAGRASAAAAARLLELLNG